MEVKLPALDEIMTDRPNDQPTDRRKGRVIGKYEIRIDIKCIFFKAQSNFNKLLCQAVRSVRLQR